MGYKAFLKTIPDNNIEMVRMNDGSIIKCKKVPIDSFSVMEGVITSLKVNAPLLESSVGYIAKCGSTPLFSALGNPSTYTRAKNGRVLSSTKGVDGKFSGQPGFIEFNGVTKEGIKAASNVAKAIPYVAIAITIVEIGFNIWKNQKAIKASQIEGYIKKHEILKRHLTKLWNACNDCPLAMSDDFYRGAQLGHITDAFGDAEYIFNAMLEDASNNKRIDENLVCTMKAALDVYSFSYLLKIVFSRAEEYREYAENAVKDIEEKTKIFENIYSKCYEQTLKGKAKEEGAGKILEFENKTPSIGNVIKRVALDAASGGLTEFGSLAIKHEKKKTVSAIEKLDNCKNKGNPFAECIQNTYALVECKKQVLRDDKYLYYQID